MNARLQSQPRRAGAAHRGPPHGYSQVLSRRVAALRTKLRADAAAALERTRQDPRTYLVNLLSKLQEQLFFDFCVQRQQQERATAAQQQHAGAKQRSQAAQSRRTAAQQRTCLARARKSARLARVLPRTDR